MNGSYNKYHTGEKSMSAAHEINVSYATVSLRIHFKRVGNNILHNYTGLSLLYFAKYDKNFPAIISFYSHQILNLRKPSMQEHRPHANKAS